MNCFGTAAIRQTFEGILDPLAPQTPDRLRHGFSSLERKRHNSNGLAQGQDAVPNNQRGTDRNPNGHCRSEENSLTHFQGQEAFPGRKLHKDAPPSAPEREENARELQAIRSELKITLLPRSHIAQHTNCRSDLLSHHERGA